MGIRARTTLAATAIAAVAFTAGALLFLSATRSRIEAAIIEDGRERAGELAGLIVADELTPVLAVGDPELNAQVVDANGNVVSADQVIVGLPPMLTPDPDGPSIEVLKVDALTAREVELDDEGPFVVTVQRIDLASGPGVILVVGSLADAGEALAAVTPLLAGGLPGLLAIVAGLTWFMTGRALRPVEEIRAEAHNISASALDRRVPVPGSRDEITRLAVTLNEMLDRLESSARRQSQFISDSSHELRSPLTAIRAMIDVAERNPEGMDAETLSDLREELRRMERLVEDLLYLAAVDESPPLLRRVEVGLDGIVRAELASMSHEAALPVDISQLGLVRMPGDPHHLARLVRNLLDNALRHAHGHVWVETTQENGTAVLVVSDDGPGVPRSERERVFERFVRLDDSRTRDTGGAGLGLAVARAVASAHGGDLDVVESLHGGASFRARFPL